MIKGAAIHGKVPEYKADTVDPFLYRPGEPFPEIAHVFCIRHVSVSYRLLS